MQRRRDVLKEGPFSFKGCRTKNCADASPFRLRFGHGTRVNGALVKSATLGG